MGFETGFERGGERREKRERIRTASWIASGRADVPLFPGSSQGRFRTSPAGVGRILTADVRWAAAFSTWVLGVAATLISAVSLKDEGTRAAVDSIQDCLVTTGWRRQLLGPR